MKRKGKSAGQRAHMSGIAGEATAARFLERKGWRIIDQRCRTPHGEIDLIALDGEVLVFVEVKARQTLAEAAEAIALPARQWQRLMEAAVFWAAEHDQHERDMRFDVILLGEGAQFRHLENVNL